MKKTTILSYLLFIMLILAGCGAKGNTDHVVIEIGDSTKFSEEEIIEAIDEVKKEFKSFRGGTLTKVWYDEEESEHALEIYRTGGDETRRRIDVENMIVLLSNFDTDSTGASQGFNPNSTYTDWNWILMKDARTGNWKVLDWGY